MNLLKTAAALAVVMAIAAPAAFAGEEGAGKPGKRQKPTFATVDANHDGAITKEEIKAMLAKNKRMAKNPDRITERADRMMKRMDKNEDGKIVESEFKLGGGRRGGGRKHRKDKDGGSKINGGSDNE